MLLNPNRLIYPFFIEKINKDKFLEPWQLRLKYDYCFEGSIKFSNSVSTKRYTIGYEASRKNISALFCDLNEIVKIPESIKKYCFENIDDLNTVWFGIAEQNNKNFYKIYLDNKLIRSRSYVKGFDFNKSVLKEKQYSIIHDVSKIQAQNILDFIDPVFAEQLINLFYHRNDTRSIIQVKNKNRISNLFPIGVGKNQKLKFSNYSNFEILFDYFNQQSHFEKIFNSAFVNFYYPSYIQIGLENNLPFFSIYYRFNKII